MSKPDPRALALTQARTLVESYMHTLDLERSECACCGLTKYRNWSDAQAHESMKAVVNRLNRQLELLENKST